MVERVIGGDANFVVHNGAAPYLPLSRYLAEHDIAQSDRQRRQAGHSFDFDRRLGHAGRHHRTISRLGWRAASPASSVLERLNPDTFGRGASGPCCLARSPSPWLTQSAEFRRRPSAAAPGLAADPGADRPCKDRGIRIEAEVSAAADRAAARAIPEGHRASDRRRPDHAGGRRVHRSSLGWPVDRSRRSPPSASRSPLHGLGGSLADGACHV
jgi:hypothetical protein